MATDLSTDRFADDDSSTGYDWSAWENFGKGARAESLSGGHVSAPSIQVPRADGLLSGGFAREIANATASTSASTMANAERETERQRAWTNSQSFGLGTFHQVAQAPRQAPQSAPRTYTRQELKAASEKGRKDGLASKCANYDTFDDLTLAARYHEGFREAADFLGLSINSIGWYLERHNAARAYKQALDGAATRFCGRETSGHSAGHSVGQSVSSGGGHGQANTYSPASPSTTNDDLSLPPVPTPPWLAKGAF